ncbi:MAG: DUF2336 domain-containing protein [Fimbriimonadaceae bacterium]|nr:DUF2336 domain-containing protein [Alphaproteobacteria bacterium]
MDFNDLISSGQKDTLINDGERRLAVVRLLTTLFLNDHGNMIASERALHEDVLSSLIDESGVMIRAEVAERFAAVKRPPLKVVHKLIRDEIAIAAPLLRHSPALSDAELIAVTHQATIDHRLAIAQRPEIACEIVYALIAREEPAVLLAVARNAGARIDSDAMARLTDLSAQDNELTDAMIRRDEDNAASLGRLFWTADSDLRHQILDSNISQSNVPSDEMNSLKYAPIRVSGLIERREALQGLAALLTSQRLNEFQIFLAQMLGISRRLAMRITSDPGGEPFAIACKAAAFPGNAFTTLLLLYNPQVSQSVQRVYALSDLYEELSSDVCWTFMEMWNHQDRTELTGSDLDLKPAIHEPVADRKGAPRVSTAPEPTQVQAPTLPQPKRAVFGRRT